MMKAVQLLMMGVIGLGLAACSSAGSEDVDAGATDSEALTNPNSTYYTLRPDFRRCVSPLCGGFFVKAVNQRSTRCADGAARPECYVAELDLAALGLSSEQQQELRGRPTQFLLRGAVRASDFPPFGNLGVFSASEAWRGHDGVVPSGTFFRATDTGIVCITFPCPSISASVLNTTTPPVLVASVDLSGISKDPSDGFAQLGEPEGLLLAATRTVVTGPAGRATGLDGSEYYLPFEGRQQQQLCGSRGLPECAAGTFCNFPPEANCGRADAPGVCIDQPEICTAQVDPVCGCDGQTYSNDCRAAAAGVSVDHRGACETEERVCGTIVGLTCNKGEFCDFGTGQCQVSDAAGVCRTQPEACIDIFDPVCGCDGRTYGNACQAAAAGVSINFEGACR